MRRTNASSGDFQTTLAHPPEDDKDSRHLFTRYRGVAAALIILALIFAVYSLLLENSDITDSLLDCMNDGEDYRKELHESEVIIDALEESLIETEDKRQKYIISLDSERGRGHSSWRPYHLSEVLQASEALSDEQVMSAFQEKWRLSENPLYPKCGLVTSRPPAHSHRQNPPTTCQIAVLTSWRPRACGIATYSSKLVQGLEARCPKGSNIDIVAVRNPQEPVDFYSKEPKVKFSLQRDNLNEYDLAADFINRKKYDIVILSYEFGIFGDSFIMCLLKNIVSARVITVMHTVADNLPWEKHALTEQVILLSHKVVVMTETMKRELDWLHSVPHNLVDVIPHGVPDVKVPAPHTDELAEIAKKAEENMAFWGINSDKVLFSNGLLHQGKGIEHVLAAMPAILEVMPETKYVIQGAPHPTGEGTVEYYEMLRNMVREMQLDDSVLFFPEFLPEHLLLGRLGHSTVYINAYVDRVASVSGTLIMAMGLGLPCISTPYPFAHEMLGDSSGILIPFADSTSITRAVLYLLSNPRRAAAMGMRARAKTHTWNEVASVFLELGLN